MANYGVYTAKCNDSKDEPQNEGYDDLGKAKQEVDILHGLYGAMQESNPGVKYYYVKDRDGNLFYVRDTDKL